MPADRLVAARQTAEALCAVSGWTDQHREVVHLRQREELSAADVSRMLGCTINHVGVLFHRARVRLRACLEAREAGAIPMMTKQVSTLVSMGSIERKPIARRMGWWLHLAMCRHGRAFRRQLIYMGRIGRSIASEFASEPPLDFEGKILDRLGS